MYDCNSTDIGPTSLNTQCLVISGSNPLSVIAQFTIILAICDLIICHSISACWIVGIVVAPILYAYKYALSHSVGYGESTTEPTAGRLGSLGGTRLDEISHLPS